MTETIFPIMVNNPLIEIYLICGCDLVTLLSSFYLTSRHSISTTQLGRIFEAFLNSSPICLFS